MNENASDPYSSSASPSGTPTSSLETPRGVKRRRVRRPRLRLSQQRLADGEAGLQHQALSAQVLACVRAAGGCSGVSDCLAKAAQCQAAFQAENGSVPGTRQNT